MSHHLAVFLVELHCVLSSPLFHFVSSPVCGSHRLCRSSAYDFFLKVDSLVSCQNFCILDFSCNFYTYNNNHENPLFEHCFLHNLCPEASEDDDELKEQGWFTGQRYCETDSRFLSTHYFRASWNIWIFLKVVKSCDIELGSGMKIVILPTQMLICNSIFG